MDLTSRQPVEQRDRKRIARLLVGGAIVVLILGNVLAAAISINGGTTVNFGQGAAGMTACASGITYSVVSDFGADGFQMQRMLVTVTDQARLDATGSPSTDTVGDPIGACDNKVMTIFAYTDSLGSTSTIAKMWIQLIVPGVFTETYTMTPASEPQPTPTPGGAPATGQYVSSVVTPSALSGLAFEITDQE